MGNGGLTVLARCQVANYSPRSLRTVATVAGSAWRLSARVGADHLGHSNVSMTQDRYMARGRIHGEVAALLDRTVGT
jgi:integrase